MTRIALVGAGRVGAHAARHLLATDGVSEVLIHDAEPGRANEVAGEIGGSAAAVEGPLEALLDLDPVAVAVAADDALPVVTAAIERGIAVGSSADDPEVVRRLLDLDPAARAASVAVVAGAGLAPGLSEVLARYASERTDHVDEVHVSRYGVSGPQCVRRRRRSSWGRVTEYDDGAWVHPRAGTGRRLVAFPEPVGPHDCRRAASAVPQLMTRSVGGLHRVSFRDATRRRDRLTGGVPPPAGGRTSGDLGGLHVEVRARRGSRAEALVYGTVDVIGPLVGAVLATATLIAAGLASPASAPGVQSLGEVGGAPVLAELARRGVRAAQFDSA